MLMICRTLDTDYSRTRMYDLCEKLVNKIWQKARAFVMCP